MQVGISTFFLENANSCWQNANYTNYANLFTFYDVKSIFAEFV